ncbi:MAG: tetratricopeptide repeat protein [Proteobacteria bacterium]|nr:tetratricopeptide repeat protein [Pseudomonadota bacterium]
MNSPDAKGAPEAVAYLESGMEHHNADRFDEAAQDYRKALDADPNYIQAHNNLAMTLNSLGRHDDAVVSYRNAIAINPGIAQVHVNLGLVLTILGRLDEAVACYRKAISINPYYAEAYGNLGTALKEQGRLDEAVANYEKAIAVKPDFAAAINNLGVAHLDLGELDTAIVYFKKAATLSPELLSAQFNYLHALLYQPDISSDTLFKTYRKIVANRPATAAKTESARAPAHPLKPGDRLRIGYLSSDFRDHPLGHNIAPLLSNHDHGRFEIFCYANVGQPDTDTEKFRGFADHWRSIQGLSEPDIAQLIRDDSIHIMVYLGGHFDDNHPAVATYRPAPVQAGIFGGTTSALDEMDFWLTDTALNPENTGEQFTEDLVRLESLFTYPEPVQAPDVGPLPAESNGFVTFASFNKPSKMNDQVLGLWCKVLEAVPDARLILKSKNYFKSPIISQRLQDRFTANGISPSRITLLGAMDSFHDHLAHYNKADIALDTFPFSGATTTFQSLWMGVPVISLMGERFIGRMGGALSTHAGLEDLVADTPEDYVRKAAALAKDLPRLKTLRAGLRQRISASPICDGKAFAANVEKAFLKMWDSRA